MQNLILDTLKDLGTLILTFSGVALFIVQYGKERLKISDNKAEVFSLIVGFIFTVPVAWAYTASLDYALAPIQWVVVAVSVVVGTIGPSGGYKLLGALSGARTTE